MLIIRSAWENSPRRAGASTNPIVAGGDALISTKPEGLCEHEPSDSSDGCKCVETARANE